MHPRQQRVNLGRQLALAMLSVGQILVDLFVREAAAAADRRRVQIDAHRIPSAVNSMNAVFVYRTRSGCRLARPLEITSGSIGITRSGR